MRYDDRNVLVPPHVDVDLRQREPESIRILRKTAAVLRNPVVVYSIVSIDRDRPAAMERNRQERYL